MAEAVLRWDTEGDEWGVRGRREPQRQTWRDLVGMASALLSLKKFEFQGIVGNQQIQHKGENDKLVYV